MRDLDRSKVRMLEFLIHGTVIAAWLSMTAAFVLS